MNPREPCLVHPLPPAPHFVGRQGMLAELHAHWQAGMRGVVALVGLGGAGKTAIAARFLQDLLRRDVGPRPSSLFVWSFYQEPDAGRFLRDWYQYLESDASRRATAKGAGLLHLLRDALGDPEPDPGGASTKGPHLVLLDGLERVQRQGETGSGYGQVEDPLLRGLLSRVTEGMGNTAALVTSRFTLTDLQAFENGGYRQLEVGGLEPPAAVSLLRGRGVKGDEAALLALADAYGAHALTLDHLGGLIGTFLDGDPARAPELDLSRAPEGDRQGLRLARLLRAYEEHLPPAELALLCRLCLLRRAESVADLNRLFLCHPAVHARTVRELPELVRGVPGLEDSVGADRALDLAAALQQTVREALCESPVAGPEDMFREEMLEIVVAVLESQDKRVSLDYAEVARLYADESLDTPSDLLPLAAPDRAGLRTFYARYLTLRDHALMFGGAVDPAAAPDPVLEKAFHELGYGPKLPPAALKAAEPIGRHDVLQSLRSVDRELRYLVAKHFALRRTREVCRLRQRKWSMAGPLAHVSASDLGRVLKALVDRRLVLSEADGSLNVHPAVRDHFRHAAALSETGSWHDLFREQFVSLVRRPGRRRPEDAATLDLVEEAIYHALQGGRTEQALALYHEVLGGVRHLAWKLGEAVRGLRILRQFDTCPDRWSLGWYLRAVGEFDAAYRENAVPSFRADIRLLQGRLPDVAREGDPARAGVAAFLMGETVKLPPAALGCAVPRDQLLLYLGRPSAGFSSAALQTLYHDIGWEIDRARCLLLLADAARRRADDAQCRQCLEEASRWVVHAGSAEHLCLYHLVRARVLRTAADYDAAQLALSEGLHLARQCGMGVYHIELLCEQGELLLARGEPAAAADAAREALQRAQAPECRFAWGRAEAGHVLGQSLAGSGRIVEGRAILAETLNLRRTLGDSRAALTERLLARLTE